MTSLFKWKLEVSRNNDEMQVFGSYGTRGLLLGSGLIALVIALMILLAPGAFYAAYGIDISDNTSLASELKAPAGALLLAGALMIAGAIKSQLTVVSLATAAAVYLSYGLSRGLSMAIDGVPHSELVTAAVIEIAIGGLCLLDLLRLRKTVVTCRAGIEDTQYPDIGEEPA